MPQHRRLYPDQGDDVFAQLEALMLKEAVPSVSFVGFGFARQATFGFSDFETKAYRPKRLEQLEINNLTGTLAWKEGFQSQSHAHGVGDDDGFRTFGGYLLSLEVGRGSVEIT